MLWFWSIRSFKTKKSALRGKTTALRIFSFHKGCGLHLKLFLFTLKSTSDLNNSGQSKMHLTVLIVTNYVNSEVASWWYFLGSMKCPRRQVNELVANPPRILSQVDKFSKQHQVSFWKSNCKANIDDLKEMMRQIQSYLPRFSLEICRISFAGCWKKLTNIKRIQKIILSFLFSLETLNSSQVF